MPEGYTHVRTAQKAATAIHYKVQCPAAFAAGANGPDSFFCYEVWKKRAKRHFDLPTLGNRMHEEKTGEFLRCLCRHVKSRLERGGFLRGRFAENMILRVSAKGKIHAAASRVERRGGPAELQE